MFLNLLQASGDGVLKNVGLDPPFFETVVSEL